MRAGFCIVALVLSSLLTPAATLAGGPITSGEVLSGSVAGPDFFESWTFSGTAGDRVIFTAVTTSGAMNTTLRLIPPGGGSPVLNTTADRADYQLVSNGTYTLFVDDQGLNDPGTYNVGLLNITSGPLTSGPDPDGGAIVSSETKTGTISGAADLDAFTFSGALDDRVIVAALATAGPGFNTNIHLYPPGGGAAVTSTAGGDRLEFKLNAAGTWIAVIEDIGEDTPGDYSVTVLNVTSGPFTTLSDLDGTTIASSQITTGTLNGVVDMDVFQFTAAAGDRVLFTDIATGGGAHNVQVTIYPPGGGGATAATSGDRLDTQALAAGTYTLVIEDVGLNDTGTYSVSHLNVTSGPLTGFGDTDGGPIVSSEVDAGTMSGMGDFDAFTFTGANNDRVILAALATAGAGFNTNLYLYPPAGGPLAATTSGGDRLEFKLTGSGTWTLVVEDIGNDTPGDYSVTLLNITSGPWTTLTDLDGTTIASTEIKTGTLNSVVDMDVFQFPVTAGDRVLFTDMATGGGAHNVQINLYPPGGGSSESATAGDRLDAQLLSTGTYTLVIEDAGLNDTGTYSLSHLNVTSGPLTSGPDPDGGAIVSSEIKTGGMSGMGDFDAFTFSAAANERVILAALATGGASFNTNMFLYAPAGGPAVTTSGGDRLEQKLSASGTWTLVVEDVGNDLPGSYAVTLLNVTSGPYTTPGDLDGTTIASSELKTGSFGGVVDLDAFQFNATSGDRVLFANLATGGGAHNAQIALYPPDGGNAQAATAGDRLEAQLLSTGTWTLVIEDVGLNDAGAYALTHLNVTAGPLTGFGDVDGGPLTPTVPYSGDITPVPDFDGFTFLGTSGDAADITCVTTAGLLNTQITLYPPGGGASVFSTTADNFVHVLGVSGLYTIVIEDAGLTDSGEYDLTLTGSGTSDAPETPGPGAGLRLRLHPANPSPFARSTRLSFDLPDESPVALRVFDSRGALVRVLVDGDLGAGTHEMTWDGRDGLGRPVGNGIYYLRLDAPAGVSSQKVVRIE